ADPDALHHDRAGRPAGCPRPRAVPGPARAVRARGPRPGRSAGPGRRHRRTAAVAVLEPARPRVRPRRSGHAAVDVRARPAGSGQPGGPPHLPGPRHADRALAAAVPAQGRPAGLGGPASGPALRGGGRLMPVTALHRQLATIALGAAARYGFALAGGNALIAPGGVRRFTADVDLFTDEEASVAAAAEAVEAPLAAAGFQAGRRGKTGGAGGALPARGRARRQAR